MKKKASAVSKVHPTFAAISKHRGQIVATIPLLDCTMYVQVVKADLLNQLKKYPYLCDELSITVPYPKDIRGAMYIDRAEPWLNRTKE